MGMFDTTEGKGVQKNEPEKKRFFFFFELYYRKFWDLIKLNLLFMLFTVPIITIGPALAAMSEICKKYVNQQPVFLLSDYWDAFKENFWNGLFMSFIHVFMMISSYLSIMMYLVYSIDSPIYLVPLMFVSVGATTCIMSMFYAYNIMANVKLKFWHILKNSLLMTFLNVKVNFITFLVIVPVLILTFIFIEQVLLAVIFILWSSLCFLMTFNAQPCIDKYLIDPYKRANPITEPVEEEESIFEDTMI